MHAHHPPGAPDPSPPPILPRRPTPPHPTPAHTPHPRAPWPHGAQTHLCVVSASCRSCSCFFWNSSHFLRSSSTPASFVPTVKPATRGTPRACRRSIRGFYTATATNRNRNGNESWVKPALDNVQCADADLTCCCLFVGGWGEGRGERLAASGVGRAPGRAWGKGTGATSRHACMHVMQMGAACMLWDVEATCTMPHKALQGRPSTLVPPPLGPGAMHGRHVAVWRVRVLTTRDGATSHSSCAVDPCRPGFLRTHLQHTNIITPRGAGQPPPAPPSSTCQQALLPVHVVDRTRLLIRQHLVRLLQF